MAKVVIIGCGSGWSRGSTRDILSYEATSSMEFVLVDTNPKALELGADKSAQEQIVE